MSKYAKLTPEDFKEGWAVISRLGLWRSSGAIGALTSDLLQAKLYERQEALERCMQFGGINGRDGYYAVPLTVALTHCGWTVSKLRDLEEHVEFLAEHLELSL